MCKEDDGAGRRITVWKEESLFIKTSGRTISGVFSLTSLNLLRFIFFFFTVFGPPGPNLFTAKMCNEKRDALQCQNITPEQALDRLEQEK